MSWKTFVAHLAVCAALVVLPALWFAPTTLWRLDLLQLAALAAFPVAYAASVALSRRHPDVPWLVALASFGAAFVALAVWQRFAPGGIVDSVPWPALVTGFALGVVAVPLVGTRPRMTAIGAALATVPLLAGATGQLAYRQKWLPRPPAPAAVAIRVDSALYPLVLTRYVHSLRMSARRGGGIARWGGGFLVANGDGDLFRVVLPAGDAPLRVRALPWRVPLDVAAFTAGAALVFAGHRTTGVEATRFRVAHVLVDERRERVRVYASHHAWHAQERCFTLRVSVIEGMRDELEADRAAGPAPDDGPRWRTLFDTSPCLPLNTTGPRGPRFEGLENGGRMALSASGELLLTVGDHGFDGENRVPVLAQDAATSYGKILRLDPLTGAVRTLSLGHRNPQGLGTGRDGRIWSTEHGPRGGDELNEIREGANYGWPRVAYGTDYGRHSWPASTVQGRHTGFEAPVFAFVPSPALSSVVEMRGDAFPAWDGDLLLGSLAAQSLFRVHLEGGRAAFVEPIQVGERIRDLALATDGRLVLWTDSGTLAVLAPAPERAGEAVVARCTACHGIAAWDRSYSAPTLAGVVGRPVAAVRDYEYSDALAGLGGRWTRARLDAFLADPAAVAPGTRMAFPGIADAEERARLIDFLEYSSELQ